MTNLRTLTDSELLRHAQVALDPIVSTELEVELLRRFELHAGAIEQLGIDVEDDGDIQSAKTLVDLVRGEEGPEAQTVVALIGVLQEHDIEDAVALHNSCTLLKVLADHDIDEPEALGKKLERIAKFDQVMQDLVEPLNTLQTLATTE